MSDLKPANPLSEDELERIQKALDEQKSLTLKVWEKLEDLEGEIQTARRGRARGQQQIQQ